MPPPTTRIPVIKLPNGRRYRADGYSPKLNKVYEFLGDFWHGNPRRFAADYINKVNKKSMGSLLSATRTREQVIRGLGYEYEEIWEDDFRKQMKNT